MFYEQKRFTLITETTKLVLTNDPINWKEVETTLARSKTSDGIFLEIKQNLEFVKDGFDFLNLLRIRKGTNVRVQLMVEDFYNNCWNLSNIGFLNMQSAKWDEIKFTCDYYDDTFNETFKNNFKEKFEVDRTTSIDGDDIGEVNSSTINLSGRQLFLQSRLNDNDFESIINVDAPSDLRVRAAIPLLSVYNSDNEVSTFISGASFDSVDASAANFIILNDGQLQRTRHIKIEGTFTITRYFADDLATENLQLTLSKYDTEYTDILNVWVEENYLYNTSNPSADVGQTISFSYEGDVTLLQEESLYLGWRFNNNEAGGLGDTDFEMDVVYDVTIDIEEESYFEPTTNPVITLKELGQRLVSIISPNALFESSLIDDNWNDVTLASGETVRNVLVKSKDDTDAEILIPSPLLTTSFEEFYNFIYTLEPCSFDVILREGKNVVILEKIDYFLNNDEVIKVGNVTEIEYETDSGKLFGSIDIGYSKSGENEEVYGLEVTHTVNSFTTPLDIDNAYEATCIYITDSNEQELTRRKQYSILPNTDSQYDKDVLVFDSVLNNGTYAIREESDRFTSVSGVFSPETIYNSIFSPMNCLLRHGKWFKNDLGRTIYDNEKIRYASSKGNVSLETQLIGEVSRKENDDITISDLDNPIIEPVTITCIAPYSFELEKQLRAITGGKRNAYKLIEVKNQNGNTVFGYLYKADIKDVIKLELKQAYGF